MLFCTQPEKLHTIPITGTVADHATHTNGFTGIWRSKFDKDLIAILELHTGEDQQTALADVAAPAIDDRGLFTMDNDAKRQIELVTLPTPLH